MTKIFYDGCTMSYATNPSVVGFTTNTTIMRQAGQKNYTVFYQTHKDIINNRPISFQCFEETHDNIMNQSRLISAIGPNVYVKVPVQNSNGESLVSTVVALLQEGVKVNITAVFTTQQLDEISNTVPTDCTTPCIVSVFGGRISDTGVFPITTIKYAVDVMRSHPTVEILWAGCKDNLCLQQADQVGCHIVTLPDAIISRIQRIGQSLDQLTQDTVRSFRKDAIEGELVV